MTTVRIQGTSTRFRPLILPLKRFIARSLRRLKKQHVAVEVILVDNREIRVLNKKYRRKDSVTNVLSFPVDRTFRNVAKKSRSPLPLGEIYLAPRYIEAHREDLRFMAAHGLLHLLGYDHMTRKDERAMQRLERRLMA